MKKFLGLCLMMLLMGSIGLSVAHAQASGGGEAYNYGDYRSSTLITKAWAALDQNDLKGVLAYTQKCIDLYAGKAKDMQSSMKDYASGSNDVIFKYWALNDVATGYYIQGVAYRKAKKIPESKEAFNKVVKDFSFGQCWDPKGWFWKPSEGAQQQLAELEDANS